VSCCAGRRFSRLKNRRKTVAPSDAAEPGFSSFLASWKNHRKPPKTVRASAQRAVDGEENDDMT